MRSSEPFTVLFGLHDRSGLLDDILRNIVALVLHNCFEELLLLFWGTVLLEILPNVLQVLGEAVLELVVLALVRCEPAVGFH